MESFWQGTCPTSTLIRRRRSYASPAVRATSPAFMQFDPAPAHALAGAAKIRRRARPGTRRHRTGGRASHLSALSSKQALPPRSRPRPATLSMPGLLAHLQCPERHAAGPAAPQGALARLPRRHLDSRSVRRAAGQVGVASATSFRWRHRFLGLAKDDRPAKLEGIAEADEMYVLESHKGSRSLQRPPRRRGGKATKAWDIARTDVHPGRARPQRPDHRCRHRQGRADEATLDRPPGRAPAG